MVLQQSCLHDNLQLLLVFPTPSNYPLSFLIQSELEPQDKLLVFCQLHEATKGSLLNLSGIRTHLDGEKERSNLREKLLRQREAKTSLTRPEL